MGLRVLLDEQVPAVLLRVLPTVARGHEFRHVHELGWASKKDVQLFRDASKAGFDVVVTADMRQLDDPDETTAIKRSKIHHVRYMQKDGLAGLALAVASVTAAMPGLLRALEELGSQHLVAIKGLSGAPTDRFEVTNPATDPPRYWR